MDDEEYIKALVNLPTLIMRDRHERLLELTGTSTLAEAMRAVNSHVVKLVAGNREEFMKGHNRMIVSQRLQRALREHPGIQSILNNPPEKVLGDPELLDAWIQDKVSDYINQKQVDHNKGTVKVTIARNGGKNYIIREDRPGQRVDIHTSYVQLLHAAKSHGPMHAKGFLKYTGYSSVRSVHEAFKRAKSSLNKLHLADTIQSDPSSGYWINARVYLNFDKTLNIILHTADK